ncbi:probable serine/threonine-protein kinase par-1 at C-terminar half [Coccomyxa sp. Obi]|nr:probable serine/threonine-protein kinase par-1 at C-terminar half [Coccomyxa sp. Obi]
MTQQYVASSHCLGCARLNGEAHTLPVLGKAGKVQMLPKALTSGQGDAGDVVCRLLLSGRHFLLVHRLALVLLPQLSRLLADVEAHPGFLPAMPEPCELMQHLHQKGAALTSHPNGIMVSYLDTKGGVGRAVISVDVAHACLELCDSDGRSKGQPVGTLDAALDTLPQQQAVKGKGRVAYELHADDGSLSLPHMPEPAPQLPLQQALEQAHPAQEEPPREAAMQGEAQESEEATCAEEEAGPASVARDPRVEAAVRSIRDSGSVEQQRDALIEVLDDEMKGRADWADTWVEHGLLEAIVHRATTKGDGDLEEEDNQFEDLMTHAAVATLSAASDEGAASNRMVRQLRGALATDVPGVVLLRLLLTVADLPSVCQVAMSNNLGSSIAAHLDTLCAAREPSLPQDAPASDRTGITDDSAYASFRSPKSQAGKQAPGSGKGLTIELPEMDIRNEEDAMLEDKGVAAQTHASSNHWGAPPSSDPIAVPKSSSKPAFVPKLLLPTSQSPGAVVGGLTRSTRRSMADPRQGSGVRTPLARTHSPAFGTPPKSFREDDESLPVTATAELSALGSALGESLIAADLAIIIAHKRQATLRRAPSSAMALHLDDYVKSVDAHRILLTARSTSSAVSPRPTARYSSSASDAAHPRSPAGRLQCAPSRLISHRSLTSQPSLSSPHAPSSGALQHILTLSISACPFLPDEESIDSQRMCLLLAALLAIAPLVAECCALRSPSSSLVSHLMAQAAAEGKGGQSCSERQRKLCIAVLHYFAAEVPRGIDIIQQPGQSRGPHTAAEVWKQTAIFPAEKHLLVHRVAAALTSICSDSLDQVSTQSFKETSALLDLLHDYVEASSAPSLPVLVESVCSTAVKGLQRALMMKGPLQSWPRQATAVMQALLKLDTILLQRCQDACLGRSLIERLVCDRRAANFRADVVRSAAQLLEHRVSGLQNLLLACLDHYAALAGLLGRQPAVGQVGASNVPRTVAALESAEEADADGAKSDDGRGEDILVDHSASDAQAGSQRGTGLRMSRMEALRGLAFLVDSAKGVAVRLLTGPESAHLEPEQSGPEAHAALRLLAAVLGAPGNPFLGSKHTVDQAVHLHFLHFAKLFHSRSLGETTSTMCRLHLEVLRAMARSQAPAVRRRFYQLRVMDLLVRELSLEYEAAQQGRLPPAAARPPSATSAGTDSPGSPARPAGKSTGQAGALSSPFLNKSGQPFKVPPLQLSPAPSATALDLRSLATGHSTPPRSTGSARSEAVTAREASFGSLAGGQNIAPSLSAHGSRPTTAGKPPLCSSRRSGHARESPSRSSRLSALQRPSSAPSSGRPFAAPSAAFPSAITPRLGRANTAVPRLLLQSAMLHAAQAGASSPPETGGQTPVPPSAGGSAGVEAEGAHEAEVLQCSESVMAETSRSDGSTDDDDDDECSSSSDCDSDASEGETTRRQAGSRRGAASSRNAATFHFTGDLDADVAALEAMEDGSSYYNCDTQRTCSTAGWSPRPNEQRPASRPGSSLPQPGTRPSTSGSGSVAAVPHLNLMGSLRLSQHSSSDHSPSEKGYAEAAEGGLGSLEQMGLGMGKMQAAMEAHNCAESSVDEPVMVLSYSEERARRVLYQDKDLHLLVLEVVLELLLNGAGQLDPLYCSHQPLERRQQNIPHLLHHHLNHPANAALAAPLLAAAARISPAAVRLLRLLCSSLFQPGLYSHRRRLARGAYAQVYESSFTETGIQEEVALKVIDVPSSIHDPCYQVDVFSEVAILERFRGQQSVCQLLNYGVEGDSFVLVMRKYPTSLKAWRARITSPPAHHLRLYLHIFADIIAAKQVLAAANVVHFDLKCDNVLLEAASGASEAEFWRPASARPPFRVVLADFGESRMYSSAQGAVTVRNRGTEYVKSPEMLLVGNAQRADRHGFDRRRREGAGPPADVWALGCLLYELLTGDFLFYDPDWIRFFVRLAQPGQELIPPERLKAVAHLPGVVELLEYMLVRDPCRRPSLSDVALRVDQVLQGKKWQLPAHHRPASTMAGSRQVQAGAGGTDVTPKQQQLLQPAVSNASELSVRYVLAEHYLSVLTPLTSRLLIGSKEALATPDALRIHSITHVLLLCCGPEPGSDSPSAAVEDGAGCLGWVLSDAGLTAAIANCTAAEAVCRVVPLGALPCGLESEEQGSEQQLLEALPGVLDFISGAGPQVEPVEARPGKVVSAAHLRRSGLDLVRSRTSSSSSDSEAGVDNFTHLPGHVPCCADRLLRRSAQPEVGSSAEELRKGPASARLPRGAAAASTDGARSTPTSARGATAPSSSTADVTAAKQWLRAQGRQRPAGSSKHRSGGDSAGTAGQRDEQSASCGEERRVLVAAAAGYEGEAAVVAIAHIMQQGLSPHEALVAASQRHVALHLQEHNRRQLAAWARIARSDA